MLPTFRRMDMDTAMHKLPEEHSRTTTPLSRSKWIEHSKRLLNVNYFAGDQPKNSHVYFCFRGFQE